MRRAIYLVVQGLITAGILGLVFHDSAKRVAMAAALHSANWLWLAGAIVSAGIVEAIGGIRWRLLLRIQDIHVNWRTATGHLLIAIFFNLVSPGLVGGDAIRMIYLVGKYPKRKEGAFAAIVMDRAMGFLSLLILCMAALLFQGDWLSQTPDSKRLVRLAAITLSIGALGLGGIIAVARRWIWSRRRFPFCGEVAAAIDASEKYRGRGRECGAAFFVTLAAHGAYYVAYFCAAQAYSGSEPHLPTLGQVFSIMPIVNTLVALPVTVAGVGLREAIFETLLGNLVHTANGVAVLIASTGFLCWAFWGLAGAILFFAYPPRLLRNGRSKWQKLPAWTAARARTGEPRPFEMHPCEVQKTK